MDTKVLLCVFSRTNPICVYTEIHGICIIQEIDLSTTCGSSTVLISRYREAIDTTSTKAIGYDNLNYCLSNIYGEYVCLIEGRKQLKRR